MASSDGGSAFPMQDATTIHAYASGKVANMDEPDSRDRAYLKFRAEAIGGMSLRDYFAAKAMQGQLLSDSMIKALVSNECSLADSLARTSYEYADAMLKARAQ